MNIFMLDEDPKKCAEYHADTHVVKMLTETAQLLSSAFYFTSDAKHITYKGVFDAYNKLYDNALYQLTHKNHPCAKWVRESLSNWKWTQQLGIELYKEYQHRYGEKAHKGGEVLLGLSTPSLVDIGLTKRPQVMDTIYMDIDPVKAYRNCYIQAKSKLLKYTNREVPSWIKEAM